ncbi:MULTISPECIES: hemerythrin domain-containing protein [Amphritea]|jgi:hemerythrin-like domain-containing protein|uniref:Hemerythrin-like domain-containing protein n=2 Tax=Amphritea TaxID=515417 RepID=A0A1H9FS72_9GAMM|nr:MULTISPECIES: hemerythrin domain-containing protein [Amphritea]MBN0986053.1 hemerythrin domain-containing protein [Amphritea pacifica]MBN1006833.1 hemerythrin domain-containing protein [Amphritea pacifica]SEQ40782.1 Hemerythrin-like domain-containing protein [Amphritea atlantica]
MTVLNELHQDHVNLNKLLAVLGNKLEQLKQGEMPNFVLLADAVDYITSYADAYHHPLEDQMYAFFKDSGCPELDEAISQCVEEHKQLKKSSQDIIEAVDCILSDAVVPMDQFIEKLECFLDEQIEHLNLEEGTLFPLLDEVATDEQWEALKPELPTMSDPLFGQQQRQRYIDLYSELLRDMQ